MVATLMQFCMYINVGYVVKVKYILMFMLTWPLCSNQPFRLTFGLAFGHGLIVREFFAYMWLEIWDNLRTLNARSLAYAGSHILA